MNIWQVYRIPYLQAPAIVTNDVVECGVSVRSFDVCCGSAKPRYIRSAICTLFILHPATYYVQSI